MAATKKAQRTRAKRHAQQVRRDPAVRLLDAVGRYVKANGGSALVAGPIGLVRGGSSSVGRHQLVISFMGRAPESPRPETPAVPLPKAGRKQ